MTLDVTLVLEIYTILVAKVVHIRVIAIVRHTDMVDIATLHDEDLLNHLLAFDSMTTIQTGLMSVHTFEFYRHIVDIQITASLAKLVLRSRSITNLHLANAKESADTVDSLTLLVGELSNEDMTIRLLGIPLLGPRQRQR